MFAVLGLVLFLSVEALKFCKTVCSSSVDNVHKYCLRSHAIQGDGVPYISHMQIPVLIM